MGTNNNLIPIETLFNGLIKKFNPQKAVNIDIIYKFIFKDYPEHPVYIQVKNQTAKIIPHLEINNKVDTTLTTTHETWQKICLNELSGKKALLLGKIKCTGNLKNFAMIPNIFDKDI